MYSNNNKKSGNRQYTNWSNKRGSTKQKLSNVPPITNLVNGTRYYSSIDGELYFGDIFVDDVTSIAWSVQQQTMPIIGYNSYTFDDVAVGARMVQGQFSINFTKRNWLGELQNSQAFRKISRRMYMDDNPATTSFSDYRQRLHLPMWDKGFDIVIGFGVKNGTLSAIDSTDYSTFLVLGCVQVTGSTMQMDYTGKPIQEVYSFIARDVKTAYTDSTEQSGSAATTESSNSNKVDTSESKITLVGEVNIPDATISIACADENIIFDSGSMQLMDSFTDKTLSTVKSFDSSSKNFMTISLDTNFVEALKKECSQRNNLLTKVRYSYHTKNDTKVKAENCTINFSLKK